MAGIALQHAGNIMDNLDALDFLSDHLMDAYQYVRCDRSQEAIKSLNRAAISIAPFIRDSRELCMVFLNVRVLAGDIWLHWPDSKGKVLRGIADEARKVCAWRDCRRAA